MEVDYAPTDAELKEQDASPEEDSPAGESSQSLVYAPLDSFHADPAPIVPPLAVGVLVFGIVCLIFWAGQRMLHLASERNRYGQEIGQALAQQPDAADPFANTTGVLPAATGAILPTAGRQATRTAYAAAPLPIDRALVTGPFLGDENRKAAKASLEPIHGLIDLIKKYDSKGLWSDTASIAGLPHADTEGPSDSAVGNAGSTNGVTPTSVTLPPGGIAPVTLPAPSMSSLAATRGATFQGSGAAASPTVVATMGLGETIERIHNNADALTTQVNLTTTPDLYPAPLRDDVKATAQELRAYLKDADVATTQDPATHAALRQRASRRLANAQQMLVYMNGVIDGTADATKGPRFDPNVR